MDLVINDNTIAIPHSLQNTIISYLSYYFFLRISSELLRNSIITHNEILVTLFMITALLQLIMLSELLHEANLLIGMYIILIICFIDAIIGLSNTVLRRAFHTILNG